MKKRYVLVLSLIVIILTMSYASAVDNDTDILNEQNDDLIKSSNQENDTISSSSKENETVGAIIKNTSSDLNVTNDSELLGRAENTNILTSSESSSSSGAVASPLSSNAYKYPTKKQRTIKIAGFKAVLTKAQYKKLYRATFIEDEFLDYGYYNYYYLGEKYRGFYVTESGLRYDIEVKTNKFIKVKVKIGNKYKIKRTRARMIISYGEGQYGIRYRYYAILTHKYNNPGYDYAKVLGKNAKYFKKCKTSRYLTGLNKNKLLSPTYVFKKYY